MRALVTGCAGFIGSHVAERLVSDGWRVTGVDAFRPTYARDEKEENLRTLNGEAHFDLVEGDLAHIDLAPLLAESSLVVHLAAQPGVRASFGEGFDRYATDNLVVSQRLFEAAREAGCKRVVWASSSSVYGDAAEYPCVEGATPTQPVSPYGVTKRACEDLAAVARRRGTSVVGLRYFTVYGPRQRPDMAIRRICEAAVGGWAFPVYGDGTQSRDFTHVSDVVDATVRAGAAERPSDLYNIGGGHEATLVGVIAVVEELSGRSIERDGRDAQAGDVVRTAADTTRARRELGWTPQVSLRDGIRSELTWVQERAERLLAPAT